MYEPTRPTIESCGRCQIHNRHAPPNPHPSLTRTHPPTSPQPSFVPVSPACRRYCSSVISGGACFRARRCPFT